MSNVRPGDLAVVIKVNEEARHLLGRFIVVGQAANHFSGIPHWRAEPPIVDRSDGLEWVFGDPQLRPIRDPGEEARDESLAWLPPVPSTTKETA